MPTEGELLLGNVLRRPADLAARGVYADWLAENGDPARGEFVSLSLEWGALPGDVRALVSKWPNFAFWGRTWQDAAPGVSFDACVRAAEVRRRMTELFAPNAGAWCCGAALQWVSHSFSGGFLDSIALTYAEYRLRARDLFAAHPITAVTFIDAHPARLTAGSDWVLFRANGSPVREFVDADLFVELDLPLSGNAKFHSSRAVLMERLSEAAVRLGCRLAGVARE